MPNAMRQPRAYSRNENQTALIANRLDAFVVRAFLLFISVIFLPNIITVSFSCNLEPVAILKNRGEQ